MTTEVKILANRLNARKSTGPKTPEGKAVVSQNALKHGLSACRDVIITESQEEFDRHRDALLAELDPQTPMESILTDRIVSLSWRLKRADLIQNQTIDVFAQKDATNPLAKLAKSLGLNGLGLLQPDSASSEPSNPQTKSHNQINPNPSPPPSRLAVVGTTTPLPPNRRPASSIEHPVSTNQHTPAPWGKYAKQTQSPKCRNQHNLLCQKGLPQFSAPPHPKKTNPIKPNELSAAISERFRPDEAKTLHITVKYEFVRGKTMISNKGALARQEESVYEDFQRRFSDRILAAHIFGRVLCLVQTVVGYTSVVCLGFGVGWLLGGYIGSIHAENIRHTINFLDFSQLRQWQDIPRTFARTGAAAGVIVCLAAARIMEVIYLNRTIISLCKKRPSEAVDIANILGTSVRQIRRRMNRLAGKGMMAYPITESLEATSSGGKRIIS